ncbi:hypothetical protein FH972_022163 [Carpinus fangiana]|uniref:WW domain-containing protein n=1 Tax=Carpinus fangiana TaxID=176857 RepID=A0A5N6KS02_9ROSI|nr:hypothetical protein FH972_022163 [Carpinus fangiana]
MNGAAAPGVWQEVKDQNGKAYYWHTGTKQTQWEKPADLKTPAELAASWKEYTAEGGRKYWHNTETQETTWDEPEAVRNAQAQLPDAQRQPQVPEFVAGSGLHNLYQNDRQLEPYRERGHSDRRSDFHRNEGHNNFVPASNPNEPNYDTLEEAEAAFMRLLKRSGVKPDWTWEQAMQATIKDPQYRGIKDPKDRKTAFEKFVQEARLQDKEKEKERVAKLRDDFNNMLRSHPDIQHYTRWKTAKPIIEGETVFKSSGGEAEKRQLFVDYSIQLRKQHAEREAKDRKAALEEISSVLGSLDLEPYTHWKDAQGMLKEHEQFQNDAKFKALSKPDVLTAFDHHIKSLERFLNEEKQREKSQKARRERQNRDQYIKLLNELHRGGKIKAGTKWMEVRPLVEEDARYTAILGQEGSTPLDLFWDILEEEELILRRKRNEAADVLVDIGMDLKGPADRADFVKAMRRDQRTKESDDYELNLIFDRLLDKSMRLMAADRDEQERRHRRGVDALRSKIKRLEPPVRVSDTWEEVRPLVEGLDEYMALPNDDLRRSAFDRVIRRLEEKEEYNRRNASRRDRGSYRNSSRGSRRGDRTPSHSREADAYEDDRRRAQAAREKSYRRSGAGGSGFSPPARSDRGDRRERDRFDDRPSGRRSERRGSMSGAKGYDRERRERDHERERLYSSRIDPRDSSVRALDYDEGGSGAGRAGSNVSDWSGGRRRRNSDIDGGERKDNKRARRDGGGPTGTPMEVDGDREKKRQEAEKEKEEENLKSGSEEGEIEED